MRLTSMVRFRSVAAFLGLTLLVPLQAVRASDSSRANLAAVTASIESELRGNILQYWLTHARDTERGGFHGEINADRQFDKQARRGSLLTSRLLWTFSAAYRMYGDPAYLEMADWAYDDLINRFWDETQGGLFHEIKAGGKVTDDNKNTYMQAFGIYGLSEYYRATQKVEALDHAIAIFRKLEEHAYDPEHGGYFEGFKRDWSEMGWFSRPAVNPRSAKSQNTMLHVMEAYTNLVRAWPSEEATRCQKEIVEIMMSKVLNTETNHLHLFLEADWTPESDEISFGHDIEFSWLLTESAEVTGDEELVTRANVVAIAVAEAVYKEAIDGDGAIFYEASPEAITQDFKEWWAQSEAGVGFLNAYQISGDEKFLQASLNVWSFIEDNLVDHETGEWFARVSRDRTWKSPGPKGHFWKAPYHNGRACMEMITRLKKLQGTGQSNPSTDISSGKT